MRLGGNQEGIWRMVQRLEGGLLRLIILGTILLLVGQLMPQNPVDELLGRGKELEDLMVPQKVAGNASISANTGHNQQVPAHLTLQLQGTSSLGKAYLLINGQRVGSFADKSLTFNVYPGDQISIDGTFYQRTFIIKIIDAAPQLIAPGEGEEIVVNSQVMDLPPVQLNGASR